MKLILENWKKYLAESEQTSRYGDLYLFENDTVTKTSFYYALNSLSESDGDVDTFLENWERSVSYQIKNLREQTKSNDSDLILRLSTQAWMVLDKFKSKAAKKILNVANKINQLSDQNPKTAKVAKIALKGLLAATAGYVVSQGVGADIQDLSNALQSIDVSMANDVADVAQNLTSDAVSTFVDNSETLVSKVSDTLSDVPGMETVSELSDSISDELESSVKKGLQSAGEVLDRALESYIDGLQDIFKEKEVGIDVRAGAKFMAGSETPLTAENLSDSELNWLTDFVKEATNNGEKDYVNVDYGAWDESAGAGDESNITTAFDTDAGAGRDVSICRDAMESGKPIPAWCYGQARKDPIMTQNHAVQFKRTLGQTNVKKVAEGVYEVGGPKDPYNFNKGEGSAPIVKEIGQLLAGLVDEKNDQKVYTTIRRIMGLRHRTGYKGYPVSIMVDISKAGVA